MMAEEKPDLSSVGAKPLYRAATPVYSFFGGSGWMDRYGQHDMIKKSVLGRHNIMYI
jgi:hypothetical protein